MDQPFKNSQQTKSNSYERASGPVDKIISVLNSFSAQNVNLTATEVCQKTGLSKTTVHRILYSLTKANYLQQKKDKTTKYAIGSSLYLIGNLYLRSMDLLFAASPVIKEMNELSREVIALYVLTPQRDKIICLSRELCRRLIKYEIEIGSTLPTYASAAGKSLLSEISEEQIDSIFPDEKLTQLTQYTIATRRELKKELTMVRKAQVAENHEEAYKGVFGVSSLVRDADGKAVAALSIGLVVYTLTQSKKDLVKDFVRIASDLISYRLGYLEGNSPVRDLESLREWWTRNKTMEYLE